MKSSLDYQYFLRRKRNAKKSKKSKIKRACRTPGCQGRGNVTPGRMYHRTINFCPMANWDVSAAHFIGNKKTKICEEMVVEITLMEKGFTNLNLLVGTHSVIVDIVEN